MRSIARHSLIGNPTIFSIGVLQAILHNEWFASIDGGAVGLRNFRQVIRMDAFLPAVTKFLLHASPGKLKPGFVEISGKLVFARHPDQDGRRIGHGLKTAFAFS